mmetsp:Transcript_64787/g.171470  ORF Transcript_64787/g.171470 Transcript_64787/m.171470 type:complete len:307 (-) Transcript_64787:596-1516(-)
MRPLFRSFSLMMSSSSALLTSQAKKPRSSSVRAHSWRRNSPTVTQRVPTKKCTFTFLSSSNRRCPPSSSLRPPKKLSGWRFRTGQILSEKAERMLLPLSARVSNCFSHLAFCSRLGSSPTPSPRASGSSASPLATKLALRSREKEPSFSASSIRFLVMRPLFLSLSLITRNSSAFFTSQTRKLASSSLRMFRETASGSWRDGRCASTAARSVPTMKCKFTLRSSSYSGCPPSSGRRPPRKHEAGRFRVGRTFSENAERKLLHASIRASSRLSHCSTCSDVASSIAFSPKKRSSSFFFVCLARSAVP